MAVREELLFPVSLLFVLLSQIERKISSEVCPTCTRSFSKSRICRELKSAGAGSGVIFKARLSDWSLSEIFYRFKFQLKNKSQNKSYL